MRWSVYAALEEEQLDEWQLYVEGRERAYGFLGEEMVWLCCVRKGNSWTSGNCTLRDGEEAMVRLLGDEMVSAWKGNSWTSGNCTLRDGKEAMVRFLGDEMVCLCCVGRGSA
jgi:hypothetical protein